MKLHCFSLVICVVVIFGVFPVESFGRKFLDSFKKKSASMKDDSSRPFHSPPCDNRCGKDGPAGETCQDCCSQFGYAKYGAQCKRSSPSRKSCFCFATDVHGPSKPMNSPPASPSRQFSRTNSKNGDSRNVRQGALDQQPAEPVMAYPVGWPNSAPARQFSKSNSFYRKSKPGIGVPYPAPATTRQASKSKSRNIFRRRQ